MNYYNFQYFEFNIEYFLLDFFFARKDETYLWDQPLYTKSTCRCSMNMKKINCVPVDHFSTKISMFYLLLRSIH